MNTLSTTHILCSIQDSKAGIFWAPMLYRSKADFIRACQQAAKDPSTMLHKFPGDYNLVVLASWCEYDGKIEQGEPEKLGSVLDLCPTA